MKKPNPPTRVLIGPVEYQIQFEDYTTFSNKNVMASVSEVARHKIRINKDHPNLETELVDTILHEAIHAMDQIYKINLKEEQVTSLANALTHFIEYNPHIPYWIERQSSWLEEQE
jgi:hypothetical protein